MKKVQAQAEIDNSDLLGMEEFFSGRAEIPIFMPTGSDPNGPKLQINFCYNPLKISPTISQRWFDRFEARRKKAKQLNAEARKVQNELRTNSRLYNEVVLSIQRARDESDDIEREAARKDLTDTDLEKLRARRIDSLEQYHKLLATRNNLIARDEQLQQDDLNDIAVEQMQSERDDHVLYREFLLTLCSAVVFVDWLQADGTKINRELPITESMLRDSIPESAIAAAATALTREIAGLNRLGR